MGILAQTVKRNWWVFIAFVVVAIIGPITYKKFIGAQSINGVGNQQVSANQVNGAAVPTSQSVLGSNSSGQLIAGSAPPTLVGTASDVTGQSASQSAVTLASSLTVGPYHIRLYADQSAVCSTGSNAVSFTLNWTDGTQARVATIGPLGLGATNSTSAYISADVTIYAAASSSVTYTSSIGTCTTGTATYDLHASLRTP